jgi:hypothetical protein
LPKGLEVRDFLKTNIEQNLCLKKPTPSIHLGMALPRHFLGFALSFFLGNGRLP